MQRGETDEIRSQANSEFSKQLLDSLNTPHSLLKSFSEFKNVAITSTAEPAFKIYTWAYPTFDGSKYYYNGYIQYKEEKSDSVILIELHDSTATILKPESEKLTSAKWFGAAYYAINKIKFKGQTYFVLLGWKGYDQRITKKVIEACYLENGICKFGFPLFKSGSVYRNRLIYSFSSQASMSLRFENNGKKIVLDHISAPKSKSDIDLSSQSGPDGTYDSFNLKKGRYILDKDVDARSETAPTKAVPEPDTK